MRTLLGLLAALALPCPAFALREVIVGNEPLTGYGKELLALLNVEERVYLEAGPLDGMLTVHFHGGPKAVNHALRHFSALPVAKHEIHYYVGQSNNSFGGGRGSSAIASWVAAHFKSETVGGVTVYDLTQQK